MADLTTTAIEDVEDVEMVQEEKRGATEKEDDRNEDIGEKEKKETKDGQQQPDSHSNSEAEKDVDTSDPEEELRLKHGLGFNEKGLLRKYNKKELSKNEGFEFDVYDGNKKKNQVRYEAVGSVVDRCVYKFLETRAGLERVDLDVEGFEGEFVFASKDLKENKDKLMVLIHGSGVVRAGQWARRLIINNGLEEGTQLPFIKRAVERGYAIIVMNTNQERNSPNQNKITEKSKDLEDNGPLRGDPEGHAFAVWNKLVEGSFTGGPGSAARRVAVVAHSYGGIVAIELAKRFQHEFMHRVFSISLTDSVHSEKMQRLQDRPRLRRRLIDIAINYVSSREKLGTIVGAQEKRIKRVSAGHDTHEWTSFSAMEALFKRLDVMLKEVTGEEDEEDRRKVNDAKKAHELKKVEALKDVDVLHEVEVVKKVEDITKVDVIKEVEVLKEVAVEKKVIELGGNGDGERSQEEDKKKVKLSGNENENENGNEKKEEL